MDLANQKIIRLTHIAENDLEYYQDIMDFIQQNNEFEPYLVYVTLENPTTIKLPSLVTVKDHLLFYVAQAAVSPSYGAKVYDWVKNGDLTKLTAKKRSEIENVLNYPHYNNIKNVDDVDTIDIKGVGDGAKSFVKQYYFGIKNICLYSERRFQKGLSIVCKRKITTSEAKKISEAWTNKHIGYMLCLQIGDYVK